MGRDGEEAATIAAAAPPPRRPRWWWARGVGAPAPPAPAPAAALSSTIAMARRISNGGTCERHEVLPPLSSHSHHRHASATHAPFAPAPPPPARPLPAFHTSATSLMAVQAASAQPICPKQVTDPLTETVRARLYGTSTLNYSSSGSHHDPSSVCLAAMVHEFLEEVAHVGSCGRARCNCVDGVCGDEACIPNEPEEPQLPGEQLCEILEGVTSCTSRPELLLLVDVSKAIEAETEELTASDDERDDGRNAVIGRLRRPVMKHLRQEGYNAAICKSRWDHGDGLPAGDYEYIDVIVDGTKNGKHDRFIVDIDFKSQFEIARASKQYSQLLDVLPRLYVGRAERLKQILKIMCNAAKRSLKDQGLHQPPWRKQRYMQAKWFSSYRRTTNTEVQSAESSDDLLGLGLRGPRVFSLEFTKEMDIFHYKAQARGNNNLYGKRVAPLYNAREVDSNIAVRRGFGRDLNGAFEESRDICTVMCTDWQLPALDEKSEHRRERVSGLSSALKKASLLQKEASTMVRAVS